MMEKESIIQKFKTMIKLKENTNKAAALRELETNAKFMYAQSWQPELQVEAYMRGVKDLFSLLQQPQKKVNRCNVERVNDDDYNYYKSIFLKEIYGSYHTKSDLIDHINRIFRYKNTDNKNTSARRCLNRLIDDGIIYIIEVYCEDNTRLKYYTVL